MENNSSEFLSRSEVLLTYSSHQYVRLFTEQSKKHGLTFRQSQIIDSIMKAHGISLSELSVRIGIDSASLVSLTARLERDGWIQRMPDTSDKRRNILQVTSKTESVWNLILQCHARTQAVATDGFLPEEIEKLNELLAKVRFNLQK